MFHILYLSKINWQVIISQAKIFNIFPGSIQLSIFAKGLPSHCNRKTFDCVPSRDLWFNRVYFEIPDSRDNIFLMIDYQNFDSSVPSKYKLGAQNAQKQFLLFYSNEKSKFYNEFLTMIMLFFI